MLGLWSNYRFMKLQMLPADDLLFWISFSFVSPEDWLYFSNINVEKADKERNNSMALRVLIDSILSQAVNDMCKQCEMVNIAFRNRAKEVRDAKHKLETLLAVVSCRRRSVKRCKQWALVISQFAQSIVLRCFELLWLTILLLQYWQQLQHSLWLQFPLTVILDLIYLSICALLKRWISLISQSREVFTEVRISLVIFRYVGLL